MNTATDCIFCKIVAGEIPCFKLLETDAVLSFMDINPYNEGHCLVIPKAHAVNLYEADDSDLAACIAAAKRVAAAVNEVVAPDGINLVQANGPGAGQSVFHFHFHIFPRRDGDGAMLNWGYEEGDMEAIGALAEKIRAAIG
ncbi:MAG: HIT family protein [Alphaproteobacteria bacterium]|nr:HIT family protein [Alphaproteobacteria bacterium]